MRKFRIPYIPYRSLLLSTTVLNDTGKYSEVNDVIKYTPQAVVRRVVEARKNGMPCFFVLIPTIKYYRT